VSESKNQKSRIITKKTMHYREMKYLWDHCNIYVLIVLSDEM